MNARRRRDFLRPLVEWLEPRRLLACEVYVRDQTLFVLGDEADNRIEIVADDRTVQVACDGGEPQTFSTSDAMRLFVETGGADDTLDIQVHPGAQLSEFEIHVGAGVDDVHVRLPAENAGIAIHAAIGAAGLSDIQLDHPPQEDPIAAARFELSIDGHEFAVFQELQGLDTEVETVEYLSSEDKETILVKLSDDENILGIKLSGQWSTASSLTIEAGMRRDQVQIVDEAGHSADMTVDVNLGDGDDKVAVDIHGDLLPDLTVETAGGNDTVNTIYVGSANGGVWKFDTGAGNDRLGHELVHTVQQSGAAAGRTEQTRQITIIQDMGPGDDEVVTHWTHDQEFVPGQVTLWDHEFEMGDGHDRLQFITEARADGFQINPGVAEHSAEIGVTDIASGVPTANLHVVDTEDIAIKAGDGDDEFQVNGRIAAALHLFSQAGDDRSAVEFHEPGDSSEAPDGIDVDGGSGRDVLTISGTDLAEVIDILGISRVEIPDPEIRVMDLATGIITAEFSIVGTEAITVDSRGGDDQIVMREVDAPLSDVDWMIVTGPGNDFVDAQMDLLPDVLHVDTDSGNDQIDVQFAASANFPPGQRRETPADIAIDVGSGVDSVMLDVFGSLLAPPGDVVSQIALVEVLAAISIQGVGLLSLLTLFPLGALEMSQAIKNDRAGHLKSQANMELAGENLYVDLDSDATWDSIVVDLAPLPGSQVDLNFQTGRGNDSLEVRSRSPAGPLDWTLQVAPGGGEDEVLVAFEHGDPDQPIIVGSVWNADGPPAPPRSSGGELSLTAKGQSDEFLVDFDLVGTPGPDDLQLNVFSPDDSRRIVADISIATGQGDDAIDVSLESAAEVVEQKVRIDSGAGADGITVLLRRLANPHLPPDVETTNELSELDLRAGEGNDVVRVDYLPSRLILKEHAQVAIDVGGGNDQVTAHLQMDASEAIQKVRIDGGAGRDRLSLDFRGAILDQSAVDVVMRGGAGNDQVRARFDLDPRSTGELSAQVFGDDGNDELGLAVLGADHLALLFALLDGGRGKDRCRTTPNVMVLNCP